MLFVVIIIMVMAHIVDLCHW